MSSRSQQRGRMSLRMLALVLLQPGCPETSLLLGQPGPADVGPDGSGPGPDLGLVGGPELWLSAEAVQFGEVPWVGTGIATLLLRNQGSAPLTIEALVLQELSAGELTLFLDGNPMPPASLPLVLAPAPGLTSESSPALPTRSELELGLIYRPVKLGPFQARLHLQSNDHRRPRRDLMLDGLVVGSCLAVEPLEANAGIVPLGSGREVPFKLHNCGNQELVLSEIAWLHPESSLDFSLSSVPAGLECVDVRRCMGRSVLAGGTASRFLVRYHPIDEGYDIGSLVVLSDAPRQREVLVTIVGRGSANRCPQARVSIRLPDGTWVEPAIDPEQPLRVAPLSELLLDAQESSDPDGQVVSYRWLLKEAPSPFRFNFRPDSYSPLLPLTLVHAGRYLLELQVVDDQGLPSCTNAQLALEVVAGPGLRIELAWETPGDDDRTDRGPGQGSDLDLHLLGPQGDWFATITDCHFANPTPDWGKLGLATDDPRLALDVVDGWGPEVIELADPVAGTYRVGVHHYDDWGYGPSTAMLRIFFDSYLRFEESSEVLNEEAFWLVAHVIWPTRGLIEEAVVLPSAPNGGGRK